MRKTINILALLFFIWLLIDAFALSDKLLYFLTVGALPGMPETISPTLMLAAISGFIGIVFFEMIARRIVVLRRIRRTVKSVALRHERMPQRRYSSLNNI